MSTYAGFGTFAIEDGPRHVFHIAGVEAAVEAHVDVLVETGVDVGDAEDAHGRLALRHAAQLLGRREDAHQHRIAHRQTQTPRQIVTSRRQFRILNTSIHQIHFHSKLTPKATYPEAA